MPRWTTFFRTSTLFLFFFQALLFLLGSAATAKVHEGFNNLRRELPAKVIVGYATQCNEQVVTAVKEGVNVVVWAFYNLSPTHVASSSVSSSLDLKCIQEMIHQLDEIGFDDTVHLVSMGGWNGPHLDPYFVTAQQWYGAWKALVGNVFHGLDVDLEGNDKIDSPWNYFSWSELDMMGEIFQLAKQDGYLVTLAPPQSYLDIQSSKFSRYVNLTDPTRSWGDKDFSYFGQNVYAYWLAKYGDYIDLVMVQFYESWSRASMEIFGDDLFTPENYLTQYVWDLNGGHPSQSFFVDFASDSQADLPSQNVPFPISKLVWGFANGWAWNSSRIDHKHVYFPPECINAGYQNLWDWMLEPRGLMFWNIAQEGEAGIHFAKGLNEVLHIRDEALLQDSVTMEA